MTRREAVLRSLREALLTRQLVPGDRLKEVQLAADLGVSRPTLREAIYQLVHEGLLVQEDYKGVTVASLDRAGVMEIATVRAPLETVAAYAIAADASGWARAELRRVWAQYDAAARDGDRVRENELHLELHQVVWVASGNPLLERIWPLVSSPIHLALSTDIKYRRDIRRSRTMHRKYVEAIVGGKRREIRATVEDHINTSAAELIGFLEA